MLMRTLYTALQEGKSVTHALQHAMKSVQSAKQYSHPANWGGWILVGHDIKLSSKIALMGHAICEILLSPGQCREAMRVLLHGDNFGFPTITAPDESITGRPCFSCF
jgi:hypothetical protein